MSSRKFTTYCKVLAIIALTAVVLTPTYFPRVSATTANLKEWFLPNDSHGPWGIAIDQSGKVWFSENTTNSRLAELDPVTNILKEWNVPSGGNPRNVFVKPTASGVRVYFTEYASNKVGMLDNSTGQITEWSLSGDARPNGIYVDNDDHIWVTETTRLSVGAIAEIVPFFVAGSDVLNEFILPAGSTPCTGVNTPPGCSPFVQPGNTPSGSPCAGGEASQLCPWGIYVQTVSTSSGTNKFVWFTELRNNMIGRLEVVSHVLTLFNLKSVNPFPYGPMDITLDTSGDVIFTAAQFAANRISIIRNQTSTMADFSIPSSQAEPTSIKWDPTRNLAWFTEYNGGKVTSLDISNGVFSYLPNTIVCTIGTGSGNVGISQCNFGAAYTPNANTGRTTNAIQFRSNSVTAITSTSISQGFGAFSEYALSTSISGPNSIAVDGSGGIWFTEQQTDRIGYLTITAAFDFGFSASASSASVSQGLSASFDLNLNLISGNAQTVALSISPAPPAGVSPQFNPPSGTPPFTSTLTLGTTSATPTGTYALTLTATGGGVTKTIPISLVVTATTATTTTTPLTFDFALSVSGDTSTSIVAGQAGSFTLNVNLLGTASPESVQLSASGQPAEVTPSFNPSSGLPPFTSTLTLSSTTGASPGDYTITATGAGGGQSHSTTVTLTILSPVKDFTLAVSPVSFNLPQASSGTATITIQSVGIFNDPVTLSASNLPSGASASFTPNPITPPTEGTVTSIATVSAPRSVSTGTYTFSITGTSGSITHKKDITLKVSGCLIATATYGSELSPEVQFLRDFRDYQILRTFAGSNFMIAFNAWYYSFSPTVANYIATHETVKTAMKLVLYPLIGVLHVSSASYATLNFEPEVAALMAGVVASSLIGLVYLALPVSGALWLMRRRLQRSTEKRIVKSLASLALALLAAFVVSEILAVPLAMILVSAAVVLTVLTIGTLLPAFAIVELARRRH